MSNDDQSCSHGGKCHIWRVIFAVLHVLLLTCMATSLWQIADAVGRIADAS
jgi:hypothetical protein